MNHSMSKRLNAIAQAIYDKKGFNILVLDVRGICSMTDYFIIAEGNVDRHVKALAGHVSDLLAQENIHPFHVDGQQEGEWVVLDYSDFIIHIFIPELRERYRLEELWSKGKVVDVKIEIAKNQKKEIG